MRHVVSLSVRLRVLVVGVALLVLGVGVLHLHKTSVEGFPEFSPPLVQVQAEALGLSAEEVEQLITVPLEQDLLNGIPWLDQIRSESLPGLSNIDMIFEPGTDVMKARQLVQEHLTQAHALPQVGTPPVMLPPVSSTSRVMMVGLGAKDLSLIDLSILARWKIRPRLMGIQGVANVAIWGQRDRQLQVQVDPDRLRRYGVTLNQVVSTSGNALWVSPLTFVEASTPGTGGFIDTSTQRFGIQHVLPITTAKGLAGVSVESTTGQRLLLGQVARVVEDHQPLIGDAVLSGTPGVMLVIEKFPNASTRDVTRAVDEALVEMAPGLAGITIDAGVYRSATFLQSASHHLVQWGVLGLVLALLVLGAFWWSWRATLVSTVAISTALVAAAWVLVLTGHSLNLMVLAGLAAALAVVIDDVMVTVDAITRSSSSEDAVIDLVSLSRADQFLTTSTSRVDRFIETLCLVRRPLGYVTGILLLLPLPALALGGVGGAFAKHIVVSYAMAVAAAGAVALVVTPALALVLAGDKPLRRRTSPLVAPLLRGFDRLGALYVRRPPVLFVTLAALLVAVVAALPQLAQEQRTVPLLQDRSLLVQWKAAPGTSLPEARRVTSLLSGELRAIPGVRDVGAHVGRALMADQVSNVNSGELWVSLRPHTDYEPTVAKVRHVISGYPGVRTELATYPEDRVRAAKTAAAAPLVVRVYGYDLKQLEAQAQRVRSALSSVRGVANPTVERQVEEPTISVRVDLSAAQRYGITPGDVRRTAATYLAGLVVGSLYEQQRVVDVVVTGTPSTRLTPGNVRNLLIDTPAGGHARLGDVASVTLESSPTVIQHDDVSRSWDVTADVRGRSLRSVNAEVTRILRGMDMPVELHAEVLQTARTDEDRQRRIAGLAAATTIAVLLLLQAAFSSWALAAMVLLCLPLAAAGAGLAAVLGSGLRSLGALLGLLAVVALAARTSTLLVDDFQRREQEGHTLGPDLVLGATRERLAPVLLSALTTAAVLAPLLALGRTAGTEILHPMAVVTLGGLVTSTVFTLLVLPGLYLQVAARLPRAPWRRRAARAEASDVPGLQDLIESHRSPSRAVE